MQAGKAFSPLPWGGCPAVFSSLVIFLEAIAAAMFGWLILNEALTLVQSLGGALISSASGPPGPKADAQCGRASKSPSKRGQSFEKPSDSRAFMKRFLRRVNSAAGMLECLDAAVASDRQRFDILSDALCDFIPSN